MEKMITKCSYWPGVACLVIALIWRAGTALGVFMPIYISPDRSVSYMSFLNGSLLFFTATVATACHAWVTSHKP